MSNTFRSGGHNPFLPLSVYIPDGEPKVFDGRVYLYGSKDEFGGEYCCHKYHVYSAPVEDLTLWTDHGPALASTNEYAGEGILDGVPWSEGLLWAPDVVKRGDWYYLYFCLSDGSEGVAKSPYPCGPFTDARQITMNGEPVMGIDPSVLQEGDTYYYTWGQGDCRLAKLNEDMCSLDPESFAPSVISHNDGREGFHEGSSLRKLGRFYCIVYASEYTESYPNRGGAPTKLDYAVSENVYGPYERRGTIIDNTGIDPSSWNNHGSIVKIGEQWYVFYHGSSNNCKYTRRARVERISVDEEKGVITQARMTSSGFAEALDPCEEQSAAYGCLTEGGAYFTEREEGFPMTCITDGCSVTYRYYDFGGKEESYRICLTVKGMQQSEAVIEINGEERAVICIVAGDGWRQVSGSVGRLSGKASLKISFRSEAEGELAELMSCVFLPE